MMIFYQPKEALIYNLEEFFLQRKVIKGVKKKVK